MRRVSSAKMLALVSHSFHPYPENLVKLKQILEMLIKKIVVFRNVLSFLHTVVKSVKSIVL